NWTLSGGRSWRTLLHINQPTSQENAMTINTLNYTAAQARSEELRRAATRSRLDAEPRQSLHDRALQVLPAAAAAGRRGASRALRFARLRPAFSSDLDSGGRASRGGAV